MDYLIYRWHNLKENQNIIISILCAIFYTLCSSSPAVAQSIDSSPSIIFSAQSRICSATVSSFQTEIASNCSRSLDISIFAVVPQTTNVVYFDESESSIYEASASNSRPSRRVANVFGNVASISVDYLHQNIYWANQKASKIQACGFRKGTVVDVVDENLGLPLSVAVDVSNQRLFFSYVSSTTARIESCDLTGSNRKIVVADVVVWPDHVVVDQSADRCVE